MILAISASALISLLIWLVILGLIFWVITWALSQFSIPEPFNKIIKVILVLIVAILAINALLTIVGTPFITW